MLQIHQLHKNYGAITILKEVTFIINKGEHVGLVGPNGVGKSTLLRCIAETETADSGTIVHLPTHMTIGYLAQAFDEYLCTTLAETIAAAQADIVTAATQLQHTIDTLLLLSISSGLWQIIQRRLLILKCWKAIHTNSVHLRYCTGWA